MSYADVSTTGALILGLLALYFKFQANKAGAANIVSDTKIKDAPLEAKQKELQDKISAIDQTIKDKMAEHDKMTAQEKADQWSKK